jgi:hypothetical protein
MNASRRRRISGNVDLSCDSRTNARARLAIRPIVSSRASQRPGAHVGQRISR